MEHQNCQWLTILLDSDLPSAREESSMLCLFESTSYVVCFKNNLKDQTRGSKVTVDENGQPLVFIKDFGHVIFSIFNG